MKKIFPSLLLFAASITMSLNSDAQITGGQNAFEFLRLSNSPHISALGGYTPAGMGNDVSYTLQNPALLNAKNHNQLALVYNSYYAGISVANLQYAYRIDSINTNFSIGMQYLNYGSFQGNDVFGNSMGNLHAVDYAIHVSASRNYLERWTYGATLKYANSDLAGFTAAAVLADVGIVYEDTANLLKLGVVAKNMGFTVKKYLPNQQAEPLPFDLQIGLSKELRNLPLRLYMVAHHLYEWDVRYDNPEDIVNNYLFEQKETTNSHFADKLFRHINFGAELVLAKKVTVSAAYNHIRRRELGYNEPGMAGFSFGLGIDLNKFNIRYARSIYATAGAYNEFGISMQLNKFFGIGKKTEPWGWNRSY